MIVPCGRQPEFDAQRGTERPARRPDGPVRRERVTRVFEKIPVGRGQDRRVDRPRLVDAGRQSVVGRDRRWRHCLPARVRAEREAATAHEDDEDGDGRGAHAIDPDSADKRDVLTGDPGTTDRLDAVVEYGQLDSVVRLERRSGYRLH